MTEFPKDGFLILDKPSGMTSQDAVTRVRRSLHADKAGHTGTLDPLATGVLPIAWGEATKVIPFTGEDVKGYAVEGELGMATDTYDAEGQPAQRGDPSGVRREDLESALRRFLGEQVQIPPRFSAVKIKGKPAYSYAHRGQDVVLKPRSVLLSSVDLISFASPCFSLKVTCSKGTYIRTLVHDLGVALGCYAHVTGLRRFRTGPFTLDQALALEECERNPAHAQEHSLSIEQVLASLPKIPLIAEEISLVRAGARLEGLNHWREIQMISGDLLALAYQGRIWALCRKEHGEEWKYARVLNRA